MQHHVLAVVSGHGLRVIPHAPYRIGHGPSERDVDVEVDRDGATLMARILADGTGGYRSGLAEGTPSLGAVLDVEQGPDGPWRIETGLYTCAFPAGFVLHSVPAGSPVPFELVDPDGAMVFLQTPHRLPAITRLAGPEQHVTASGPGWVELTYVHDGRAWWQRHELRPPHVVTAQAPASLHARAAAALRAVVDSLVDAPRPA